METLLKLSEPPTAVFCYNDMTALGALRTIRARGLSDSLVRVSVGVEDERDLIEDFERSLEGIGHN